jgi:hypothetical protein
MCQLRGTLVHQLGQKDRELQPQGVPQYRK